MIDRLSDEDFAALAVGDEVLLEHRSGLSGWVNVGRVTRRTAKQVTVRAGGRDYPVRSRSREWSVGRATPEWLAARDEARLWGRIWRAIEAVPKRPFYAFGHYRWRAPEVAPEVLAVLSALADAWDASQAVGEDDGGGEE